MSNSNKKNAAILLVAGLLSAFETAKSVLEGITVTVSPEEIEAAQIAFDSAKDALGLIDETATPEEKEIAQLAFDSASEALNAIKDLPTPEDKEAAQLAFDTAKEAYEKATAPKAKEKTLHGTFLLSPTGKFGLAYNAGESADLPELQAVELKEAGYFKFSK